MRNFPDLDTAPAVAALLKRESELIATLGELRQPRHAAPGDDLKREASRLLGDAVDAAPLSNDERTRQARICETALADLRGRIQAARTQARREMAASLGIIDDAAKLRQGVADAAGRMLEAVAAAEEFGKAVAFADLAAPDTWAGDRQGWTATLAGYLLALEEAGATVAAAQDLDGLAGRKSSPPPDWELRLRPDNPATPAADAARPSWFERILE